MSEAHGLEDWRQETIDRLTTCYSEDRLSVQQFEARVEQAGAASSVQELATLLSDMPAVHQIPLPRTEAPWDRHRGQGRHTVQGEHDRAIVTSEPRNVTSILSERKLQIDSTHSNAVSVLGDLKITVPHFSDIADTVYVQVAAVLSEVTIVVPNGIVVDNRITPMLSEIKDTASRATRDGPVLRLDGFSLMSEVKIRSGLPT